MRFWLQLLLLSLTILFLNNQSFSQTGKIAGKVIDAGNKQPLVGANIIIMGTSMGAAADIDGNYFIIGIPPGVYTLKVSAIGYQSEELKNVRVSIDLTTREDFSLKETTIQQEAVVVTASKPLVQKDLTASTSIVDSRQISSLPVSNFQDILQLQAGIITGSNGDLHVRGGRAGEVVYAIDGVPLTDVYDGSNVVDVAASSIQELQFVSGAFNAEYGRALSGYVNIATKDGGDKLQGTFTTYWGGHYTTHTDIFHNDNIFRPGDIRDVEGSLGGPIIADKLSFYAFGRYLYNAGWIYGQNIYNPWNITINNGPSVPVSQRYILSALPSGIGDSAIVSMNWNEEIYGQGKLTWKPLPNLKVDYNYIIDNMNYQVYNQAFTYDPKGNYNEYKRANTNIFSLTHTVSASTFYRLDLSYFYNGYQKYVYADVNDPRWTNILLLSQTPTEVPSFNTGGTGNELFRRGTGTYGIKFDLTSQVTQVHQMKVGFEYDIHNLTFADTYLYQSDSLQNPSVTLKPFAKMYIPNPNDPTQNLNINLYTKKPIEASAYIQDKIELNQLIINIGVRADYFRPDGFVLNDPLDPNIYNPVEPQHIAMTMAQRQAIWYKKATDKYQISPRLGVAFPITADGVIHFSYGEFFQIPNFDLLYTNPEFKFGQGTGNLGVAGNADLKAEQTISYEVGLQQAISDEISFDITAFARDIRNLAGTTTNLIPIYGGAATYVQYVNSDFGFVKGVTVSLTKRLSNHWSATLDYTLQSAKGNASDPNQTINLYTGGARPSMQLVPLNWDQTNTINATLSFVGDDNWGFSFIGQYGSGLPYTPSENIVLSSILVNAGLKPSTFNIDMKAYKDFIIGKNRLSVFLRIYNLLDIKNMLNVYNDSGVADYTSAEYQALTNGNPTKLVNTVQDYYNNPSFYSEPRRIEFGTTFYFNE
jgi:outer membrane receptor for ferrienterochelin and colicin